MRLLIIYYTRLSNFNVEEYFLSGDDFDCFLSDINYGVNKKIIEFQKLNIFSESHLIINWMFSII